MSTSRWAGDIVRQARAYLATTLPVPCRRCGRMIYDGEPWDVGHIIDKTLRPDLMADPSNWSVEHRHCNRSAGGRKGRAMQLQRPPSAYTSRRW